MNDDQNHNLRGGGKPSLATLLVVPNEDLSTYVWKG